jgi:uncharacterized protein YdiU (UPF0061 family)
MIDFQNTYSQLPRGFFEKAHPAESTSPKLIKFNHGLAKELGLDFEGIDNERLARIFSGKELLPGSEPLAMAYAGHQFGNFVPQLGDGRALLLGEVIGQDKKRYDIQLKGSGQTPFSRRGDGLSSLGPVIREYILSEAMYHLGVPTTRSLAAVVTDDHVLRETQLPRGIFTRVSLGHIRVGTFEYFSSRGQVEKLKTLADYCLERLYPEIDKDQDAYLNLFVAIAHKKLDLVAKWMGLGFIHGVMNTDNTSVAGETIDFGPCAFMDQFSFEKVYSSIDRNGRYAYKKQGKIALWNLLVLANCLIPLIDSDEDKAVAKIQKELEKLPVYFEEKWLAEFKKKLGLFSEDVNDQTLVLSFLEGLQKENKDYTNSFRGLSESFDEDSEFHQAWRKRLDQQSQSQSDVIKLMNQTNPVLIPRNHQVEKAIQGALKGNFEYFHKLNEIFLSPYKDEQGLEEFKRPPKPDEIVHQTFCGT